MVASTSPSTAASFTARWSSSHSNTENWSKLCYLSMLITSIIVRFLFLFPKHKAEIALYSFFQKDMHLCSHVEKVHTLQSSCGFYCQAPFVTVGNIVYLLDCGGLSRY